MSTAVRKLFECQVLFLSNLEGQHGAQTRNPKVKSPVLLRLSYSGIPWVPSNFEKNFLWSDSCNFLLVLFLENLYFSWDDLWGKPEYDFMFPNWKGAGTGSSACPEICCLWSSSGWRQPQDSPNTRKYQMEDFHLKKAELQKANWTHAFTLSYTALEL